MFGIEDPYVWLAYLLCLLGTGLCILYGLITRYRGEAPLQEEDIRWASEERHVEEEL